MNVNIAKSNAATNSTTAKQEKYEKKMAKYAANKARKEQKKKEKMDAQWEKMDAQWEKMDAQWDENFLEIFSDKEQFTNAYIHILAGINDLTKGEIDVYPFKAQALFINEKVDLAKRYMRVYQEMIYHEENQGNEYKRTFIRNTEALVYNIMWLDVCGNNKELLGPTGYDTLQSMVNNMIADFLDGLRKNPDYLKGAKSGVFVPKIVFEWLDRTTGSDFMRLNKVA